MRLARITIDSGIQALFLRVCEITFEAKSKRAHFGANIIQIQLFVRITLCRPEMVRPTGFEPMAPRLGIWCSILLSYGRAACGFRRPRQCLQLPDGIGNSATGGARVAKNSVNPVIFHTFILNIDRISSHLFT
jgi:hypothetical protein